MNHPDRPGIRIIGSTASGNKRGGIFIGKGIDADIVNTRVFDNGGRGIEVEGAADSQAGANSRRSTRDEWYKKPLGIVGLAVAGALLSAAAMWAIQHYLS